MLKELDEVGSYTANDVGQVSSLSAVVNNFFQAHQHILSLTVSKPGPLSVDADIFLRPVSPTVTVDGRNSSMNNKHFRKIFSW